MVAENQLLFKNWQLVIQISKYRWGLAEFDNIQEVMSLSQERNAYTQWLILQSIMKGKIPCISTERSIVYFKGFGKNRTFEFSLISQVQNVLGSRLKVILLLPSDSVEQIQNYDNSVHIHTIYQSELTELNIYQTVKKE